MVTNVRITHFKNQEVIAPPLEVPGHFRQPQEAPTVLVEVVSRGPGLYWCVAAAAAAWLWWAAVHGAHECSYCCVVLCAVSWVGVWGVERGPDWHKTLHFARDSSVYDWISLGLAPVFGASLLPKSDCSTRLWPKKCSVSSHAQLPSDDPGTFGCFCFWS